MPPAVQSASAPLGVASARDLGVLFARNAHRMVGQDGAFSIPLEPGRTLWFFGDTLIGRRPPAGQSLWTIDGRPVGPRDMTGRGTFERMINNTGLVLRHRSGGEGLDDFRYICDDARRLRPLIPLQGDELPDRDRIWCQHGIALDGVIWLSFIKVRMLEEGPLPVNFEIVGSGLARGSERDFKFQRVTRNGSSILWSADQPHFATAFLAHPKDGYVYLYGTVKESAAQNCYIARTRPDAISQIEKYEYLTNCDPAWSRDIGEASVAFSGMPSELSVSFNAQSGCLPRGAFAGPERQDCRPNGAQSLGPWSEPTALWDCNPAHPQKLAYMKLMYAGKEHPELAGDNARRIYLTYIEFEEYFPHLVEVTLAERGEP